MIYTSYFARIRKLPDNFIPVAICGKYPEGYHGNMYKKLAPKYGFFQKWKETHDNDYYIHCFNEQVLSILHVGTVIQELSSFLPVYSERIWKDPNYPSGVDLLRKARGFLPPAFSGKLSVTKWVSLY